jgi:hypothetical protein
MRLAWALAVHAKPAARTSAGSECAVRSWLILTIRRGTLGEIADANLIREFSVQFRHVPG